MSVRSEVGPSTRAGATVPGGRPGIGVSRRRSLPSVWGAAVLIAFLFLTNPLIWTTRSALWAPSAGLALVVVAWLGLRPAVPLLLASAGLVYLVALSRTLFGWPPGWGGAPSLVLTSADLLLGVVEAPLAWWLYHAYSRGSGRLSDPRSATTFLFVIPGMVLGGFAVVRTLLAALYPGLSPGETLLGALLTRWMERALGVLIVAPPLLVTVTPWLLHRRWIRADSWASRRHKLRSGSFTEAPPLATAPRLGDWLEVIGLAIGASILCLLLLNLYTQRELFGWQLWGVQLLLILWACMRQGLRGGTLVAATAAAAPLVVLSIRQLGTDPFFVLLLQAHLLAQCAAALLIAAAATWVRVSETGYRRVVAHIPVVIYSARMRSPDPVLTLTNGDQGLAEITLVSAASAQLLGCPAEQLLGDYSRWLARIHPDDREVVFAALAQLTRQDNPVTCEYRVILEPGSSRRTMIPPVSPPPTNGARPPTPPPPTQSVPRTRWLRDTLAPTRDAEGRLVGWEGVVIDINEQRTLADDLRRATSMFHALVSNLPTGVFFVQGPLGQPIFVNARARHLLGQREDPSAGLDYLSRVYRLHRPDGTPYPAEELPVYQALRAGRATVRDDIVVHRSDGRRIPLVTWAAPVHLAGRRTPDAAVWVLEDLTALHQAEAARQDSESRLRAVIETMGEGLLVQNRRGQIVDCNPSASCFLGMSADQLRGRSYEELNWSFVEENGTEIQHDSFPSQQVLRTRRPVRNVVIGMRRGPMASETAGSGVRWILVNAMPLGSAMTEDESGPAGVVTTFSDISAYVQARAAIQASEKRYRELIDALPIMIVQSDRTLTNSYVNPAFRQESGMELDDIRDPNKWERFVHPDDLGKIREVAARGFAGESVRLEFRGRHKDGREKEFFALAEPQRSPEGEVVGLIALILDMTRERQLERDLQRSQRLEVIGQLASGVAHDFNNLLNVILNLADLARVHLPIDHPVMADLSRITEAGDQATALAGQLLAFSRNRRVATRRIDLHAILRRTLGLVLASQARLRVESDLWTRELFIQADETQLQQVMMNLFLNARDAMPEGGLLRVQTRVQMRDKPFVVLSVIDSGKGMTEELRGRIFEPFFTTREGGTGLGLAVVKQIVEAAGGSIEVSSEVGKGARFDVWWPLDAVA
jgi:PAS domain S-box-containing protein